MNTERKPVDVLAVMVAASHALDPLDVIKRAEYRDVGIRLDEARAAVAELIEAATLHRQTQRPFAPKPDGLGLEYTTDNLLQSAWMERQLLADKRLDAALARCGVQS